jgi:hypothetical protein
MKKIIILIAIATLASCAGNKKDEQKVIKKVVCGDSFEQEQFDVNGTSFITKVPGKCDTIIESKAK